MALFSTAQIIDKTFIATRDTVAYIGRPNSSRTIKFKSGDNIGKVYSYIKDKLDGSIWWEFYPIHDKIYYVKHKVGIVDVESIEAQGAKSVETISAEKQAAEEMDAKGTFIYYAERWGLPILGTIAALYIGGKYLENRK